MGIGPYIRRAFGPLEKTVAESYRRLFVDLDGFAERLRGWAPGGRILEVGCGEGMLTQRLMEYNPHAEITGIDITSRIGRLVKSDCNRVTFRQTTIRDFAESHSECFDMAVVCDVIHHVPWPQHEEFVAAIGPVLRRGGVLVLKDWEPWPSFSHLCCYLSCRYLTGDRVRYPTLDDLRSLVKSTLGSKIIDEFRLPPSRHNVAIVAEK